jgi:hypothetical protein
VTPADVKALFDFARGRTLGVLDAVLKEPDPRAVLGWRPGPGRAHIAWQLMHLGATDDRHLNVRMTGGQPAEPEYVRRFAGGSTPDDDIPTPAEIRRYLGERRAALLAYLATLTPEQMATKPTPDAPGSYEEWVRLLAWHEAHHQGQAHLTLNLYKASR